MKVKYNQIMSSGFVQAFSRMAQAPLPLKASHTLVMMNRKLDAARKQIVAEHNKKFGQDVGQPKTPDQEKEIDAFGEQLMEIDRYPLGVAFLEQYFPNISAVDLAMLEPILGDLSTLEDVPVKSETTKGPRAV